RLLRAIRMHDRRESAADEYFAAGDRKEKECDDSNGSDAPANCASEGCWRRQSDRRELRRREGRGIFSAGGDGGAGVVDSEQHAVAAAFRNRRALRCGDREGNAGAKSAPSSAFFGGDRVFWQAIEPVHGCGGGGD